MTALESPALLFDLDETLVGLRPGTAGLDALRAELVDLYLTRGLVPAHRSIFRMYAELSDLGHRDIAHRTIERHEVQWAEETAVPLIDGDTVSSLIGLRSRNALVTNNARACVEVLVRRGLLPDAFAVVVARDDVDRLKPDAEPVLRGISALSGHADRPTVFFGDSVSDQRAAKAARTTVSAPLSFVHIDAHAGIVVSAALLHEASAIPSVDPAKDLT